MCLAAVSVFLSVSSVIEFFRGCLAASGSLGDGVSTGAMWLRNLPFSLQAALLVTISEWQRKRRAYIHSQPQASGLLGSAFTLPTSTAVWM